MKKRIVLFLIFLLLINIAGAGETYTLDFKENPAYLVGLKDGDRVQFNLKDSLHTILIKKIKLDSVDIAVFTSIEDKNISQKVPVYTNLNSKKFLKLDVEKDGNPDLNVIYKNSNSSAVSVLFQLPIGPDKNLVVFPKSQFEKDNFLKNLMYLFIAFVVVFALLFLLLRKKAEETEKVIENKPENNAENKPEKLE